MEGNYTAREWLQMGNRFTTEQIERLIEENEENVVALQFSKHSNELAEEQLYFARNAIEGVLESCKKITNCRELKKAIDVIVENSGVEL
jgi:hypothetical protein